MSMAKRGYGMERIKTILTRHQSRAFVVCSPFQECHVSINFHRKLISGLRSPKDIGSWSSVCIGRFDQEALRNIRHNDGYRVSIVVDLLILLYKYRLICIKSRSNKTIFFYMTVTGSLMNGILW